MSKKLAALAALSTSAVGVMAQQSTFPATPLASKRFAYPTGLPYQADTESHLIRGGQSGYNICNSTTAGQDSMCQTNIFNSIDDFCLWGPPEPNMVVGDHEGEMVAWCTKEGHGTRLIPEGALTGVQWIRAPAYVSVVGFIDQTKINIRAGDWGGEMDPHGADLRGNPLGGLLYSNAFTGGGENYVQVIEWHNFIGGNSFCFKACDPAGSDDDKFCEHVFDRIGCAYNVPSAARDGVFESCEGENQDFPGTYTLNGQVMTYTQPPEALGAISTMPYTARVPASSNCRSYDSTSLFAALATVRPDAGVSASSSGVSASASGSATGTASSSRSTGASASSSASGSAANAQNTSNDAVTLAISGVSVLGVVFSALFLS
ncbi:hypothetical protein BDQ12DRAFT_700065 [Crucibulum laeve]|uniref:Macrofage activating glycoprotein n=1 Tax=Crucibulum laeve TaxID=68775 RepID=A0A5C3LQV3_9AGAR|nr:hypothetical protein BDQ12DRAFT_700065 [Crucibulum laeve]